MDNPDFVVIDVRTPEEFADGYIDNAINIDFRSDDFENEISKLDKSKTYLVYCHVDSVAIQGAQKLIDAGFENVYRLEGNYGAWVDAGYPIEQ